MALLARPNLQPVITTKMIRLTLAHGITPHSSVGFAAFGMLHAKLVSIPSGYRWTKLARRMLDKHFSNGRHSLCVSSRTSFSVTQTFRVFQTRQAMSTT